MASCLALSKALNASVGSTVAFFFRIRSPFVTAIPISLWKLDATNLPLSQDVIFFEFCVFPLFVQMSIKIDTQMTRFFNHEIHPTRF